MSDAILACEGIEKRFFGVRVLRDVSFALHARRVLGLVGENGAGKSTLMNILGGVLPADAGRMRLNGDPYQPKGPADATEHGIAFIHQELNLFTNLSIAENIFLTDFPRVGRAPLIRRRRLRAATRALLDAVDLDLSPDTLVEALSPGERQMVEIAKALSVRARILILDEPTTSLTARETERLFAILARLRAQGLAMIYISHILGDVLRLCDDVLVLRDGAVVGRGPRDAFSLERLITLMVGRTIDQLYPPRAAAPLPEPLLEVEGVTEPGIVRDVSFTLHRGEVLGVAGLMGSGRTELARILFGLDPMACGRIAVRGADVSRLGPRQRIRRGMAFLTERRLEEGLLLDASIADNVALVALPHFARPAGWVRRARLQAAVAGVADSVRLDAHALERRAAKTLSGGNQQKVVLAKWLLEQPAVFLLDEPTRGIDIGAKHEVYRLINDLTARGAGVLFISSEIEELIGLCDRILVMNGGQIAGDVPRAAFDKEALLRAALKERVPA